METSPSETNSGLLYVSFNQDFGCFVSVTGRGFRIFNADPLREKEARTFTDKENEDTDDTSGVDEIAVTADATLEAVKKGWAKIVKAEMLFRCNYVALVVVPTMSGASSLSHGHKVVVWDDLKRRGVIQLEFNAEVRAVRLRRDRIVVVLKNMIKVYTFTASPQQLHVFDTAHNWRGLCSLSPSSARAPLAFPAPPSESAHPMPPDDEGDSATGRVKIVDLAKTEQRPFVIAAHASKLSCITLNVQGTRLATASDKGTLIRVFDALSGTPLSELRRGTQPAQIYSINFSADSGLLVTSSSNGTIHVFSVEDSSRNKHSSIVSTAAAVVGNLFGGGSNNGVEQGSSSSSGVANGTAVSTVQKFMPKYFTSEWSFSRMEVPGATRCIVAFANVTSSAGSGTTTAVGNHSKNNFAVMAVCADGSFHKFVFDEKTNSFTRDVYHMFLEPETK